MDRVTRSPRALVLGIDGGSFELIDPLLAQGRLPHLARLLARSAHGATTTTWPAHTAPGWATFVSARQPGGHGIYQFFDTQDADYGDRLVGTDDFGCSTVWEWVVQQGLSVGLVNVPMSHPPRDVPGYQLTWPLMRTLRYCRPAQLLGELARAGAPFKPDIAAMFTGDLDYLDAALEHVTARTRSAMYMMRHHPVDVMMFVITEIDRICHHYWHFADTCHPAHASGRPDGSFSDAIGATYQAIDDAFGELLDAVDEDTVVMLVSDHGFGTGRNNLSVNAVLAEAGLLSIGTEAHVPPHAGWFHAEGRAVDFTKTRAYMPTPGCYAVNVNRVGRQTDGCVPAGQTASVLDEVADLMLGLRTPDTGKPVFSAALPRADAYPGAMTAKAPDLLLVPSDEATLASPAFTGDVWGPSEQTGLHRHIGMWSIAGPGVPVGRTTHTVVLEDLAPTLLHQLGLAVPADVDGRPWSVLLENTGPARPLVTTATPERTEANAEHRVRDDNLTAQMLRAMGYL